MKKLILTAVIMLIVSISAIGQDLQEYNAEELYTIDLFNRFKAHEMWIEDNKDYMDSCTLRAAQSKSIDYYNDLLDWIEEKALVGRLRVELLENIEKQLKIKI